MDPATASACPYLASAILDNSVALVTSAHGGRRNVMTASFFAESSHIPVLLRVAIAPASWTHELIERSGWFGLSILAANQASLALACGASSGRDGSKFDRLGLETFEGPEGTPLLPGCLTTSACRVVERHDMGEHTLFVGHVVASYRQSTMAYRPSLVVSDLVDYLDRDHRAIRASGGVAPSR
jgi:flavin reductase (DIM6/NTAB) family NADH-FMN oxidoreductase RutF